MRGSSSVPVGVAPSVARNSFARLFADGGHLGLAFVAGIITARWLTPEGKGAYSALLSLIAIGSSMASLGLGEASAVLLGRRETDLGRFLSATVVPVLVTSGFAAVIVTVLARVQLADQGPTLGRAVFFTALAIPIAAAGKLINDVANAREKIVATSIVRVSSHAATVIALLVLVVGARLHLTGAILAIVGSSLVVLVGGIAVVRRLGAGFRPVWDSQLLRRALGLGLAIELSHSLLILAARLDVLFVYSIAGRAPAGRYSVALTVGQLVGIAASAVSFALYPRVARISDEEGYALVAKASRVGLAMSLLLAIVFLVAVPVALPLAFGSAYRPSVGPALILLVGGVFWGEQLILTRARTARGRTRLQVWAHGATLVVMVAFDFLLIPRFGIEGAAIASVAGAAAGLAVCIASYRRDASRRGTSLMDFLPGLEDLRFLFRSLFRPKRAEI